MPKNGDIMEEMTEGQKAIMRLIAEEAADRAVDKMEPRLKAVERRVYIMCAIIATLAGTLGHSGEIIKGLMGN